MAQNDTVEKTTNTLTGIMFVSVLLGVLLLSLTLIVSTANSVNTGQSCSSSVSTIVANETGGWINETEYILGEYASGRVLSDVVIIDTDDNSTFDPALYSVNYTSWAIKNATSPTALTQIAISYVYTVTTITTTDCNLASYNSIQAGVIGMVVNFFALAPTIGTILAVVILIGGIVLLVIYVRKMKDTNTSDGSFQG